MIFIGMLFGPLLLLAGVALRADWREALAPLVTGLLLTAAWTSGMYLPHSTPANLLWMFAPGMAGMLLLVQTTRTSLGPVMQGMYAAGGLVCIAPSLLFAFILYALSGDVQGS